MNHSRNAQSQFLAIIMFVLEKPSTPPCSFAINFADWKLFQMFVFAEMMSFRFLLVVNHDLIDHLSDAQSLFICLSD